MNGQRTGLMKQVLGAIVLGVIFLPLTAATAQAGTGSEYDARLKALEDTVYKQGQATSKVVDLFKGLTFSGQTTMIYQTSDLHLNNGDLPGVAASDYAALDHKSGVGTFSADLIVEKEFDDGGYFMFNLEFANGSGIDAPLQGGALTNNDVMEDPANHNQPYIARAYYERTVPLNDDYALIIDVGKFGVPDFFDELDRVSDQTSQFINQAICNNGAFDFVADLEGHGYTYGFRAALDTPWVTFSGAAMSSDSYLDNIHDKHSFIGAIAFNHEEVGF